MIPIIMAREEERKFGKLWEKDIDLICVCVEST